MGWIDHCRNCERFIPYTATALRVKGFRSRSDTSRSAKKISDEAEWLYRAPAPRFNEQFSELARFSKRIARARKHFDTVTYVTGLICLLCPRFFKVGGRRLSLVVRLVLG